MEVERKKSLEDRLDELEQRVAKLELPAHPTTPVSVIDRLLED